MFCLCYSYCALFIRPVVYQTCGKLSISPPLDPRQCSHTYMLWVRTGQSAPLLSGFKNKPKELTDHVNQNQSSRQQAPVWGRILENLIQNPQGCLFCLPTDSLGLLPANKEHFLF